MYAVGDPPTGYKVEITQDSTRNIATYDTSSAETTRFRINLQGGVATFAANDLSGDAGWTLMHTYSHSVAESYPLFADVATPGGGRAAVGVSLYSATLFSTEMRFMTASGQWVVALAALHCSNEVQDFDEEGVDCGGSDCANDCKVPPRDGLSKETAAQNCKQIKDAGFSTGTGTYWIGADTVSNSFSDAFEAHCEMAAQGGGWTLCGKITRNTVGSAPRTGDVMNDGGVLTIGTASSYGWFCDKVPHDTALGYVRVSGGIQYAGPLSGTFDEWPKTGGTILTMGDSTTRLSVGTTTTSDGSTCASLINAAWKTGGGCPARNYHLGEVRIGGTSFRNQECSDNDSDWRQQNTNSCGDDTSIEEMGYFVR